MPAGARKLERVTRPLNPVGRWRGCNGQVVVLTATGGLWRRQRTDWRRLKGEWTAESVEAWAATQGYLRVGDQETVYKAAPPWPNYLSAIAADGSPDCVVVDPHGGDYRGVPANGVFPPDQLAARLDYYAERAALKLPLFDEG